MPATISRHRSGQAEAGAHYQKVASGKAAGPAIVCYRSCRRLVCDGTVAVRASWMCSIGLSITVCMVLQPIIVRCLWWSTPRTTISVWRCSMQRNPATHPTLNLTSGASFTAYIISLSPFTTSLSSSFCCFPKFHANVLTLLYLLFKILMIHYLLTASLN